MSLFQVTVYVIEATSCLTKQNADRNKRGAITIQGSF